MRKIEVVDYSSDWARKYQEERGLIKSILGDDVIAIYHIGSTSIEGLKAKPIIDILLVVEDLDSLDGYDIDFRRLGYEPMGEYGIEERRFYMKGGDERSHHIHAFSYDNLNEIMRHLIFRDYLRENEDVRKDYEELKESLAVKYPYDNEGYCDGKDEFVKRLEKKALINFLRTRKD